MKKRRPGLGVISRKEVVRVGKKELWLFMLLLEYKAKRYLAF